MVILRMYTKLLKVDARWVVRQARVLQNALADESRSNHEMLISITTSAHLRRLNRRQTGKDATTDVLSFAAQQGDDIFAKLARDPAGTLSNMSFLDGTTGLPLQHIPRGDLGEIYISAHHVIAHATALDRLPHRHLTCVLAHAIAHLCGHDHDSEVKHRLMRDAEIKALKKLGDPFLPISYLPPPHKFYYYLQ